MLKYIVIAGKQARLLGIIFASFTLAFAACDGLENINLKGGNLTDPGPDMSFEVELTVDSVVASQFLPVRVFVEEASGKAQLGYTVVAPVSGTRRYKITLPESYKETKGIFVVELSKLNSNFENVAALQESPIALSMLKSRYVVFDNQKIPAPSEKIKLELKDITALTVGYGPGGLKLKDIPDAPPIYFLNLELDPDVAEYGFEYAGGIATSYLNDKYPPFSEVISILSDTANIHGISSPLLDWALIMRADAYTEGEAFSLFIYVKQPVDPLSEHACPCRSSTQSCGCDFGICPYKMLNSYFGQDFYPIHIQIEAEDIKDLERGETISVQIVPQDFLSCEEMGISIPQMPSLPDGILPPDAYP
ncbi:MAG: hypothetical protein LBC27_10370 [Spirochaetaceae bacterium]|jgi:hypothetical protein|nr:hypothetical protein [Spirochaetaceae bacterium]